MPFVTLPLEIKLKITETVKARQITDARYDTDKDADKDDHCPQARLIGNLRLTCRRNDFDYRPQLARLRDADITLDSYGVQQLRWLASSTLAPSITGIRLIERDVVRPILVWQGFDEDEKLSKKARKQARLISGRNGFGITDYVTKIAERSGYRFRPWDLTRDEYRADIQKRSSKYPILGVRYFQDDEYRSLTDDDGSEANLSEIANLLSKFESLKRIELGRTVVMKSVVFHADGSETPGFLSYMQTHCPGGLQWQFQSRALFSTHVVRLLSRITNGASLRTLNLPMLSHGTNELISGPVLPTADEISAMCRSLSKLSELHFHGSHHEFSQENIPPDFPCDLSKIVLEGLTANPLPELECICFRECALGDTALNALRAHKLHKLHSLEVTGYRDEYHQFKPQVRLLLKLLMTMREMPTLRTAALDFRMPYWPAGLGGFVVDHAFVNFVDIGPLHHFHPDATCSPSGQHWQYRPMLSVDWQRVDTWTEFLKAKAVEKGLKI